MEHTDVHNVVVIHILYLDTIVVVGTGNNLVLGGIDGDIPVITIAIIHHHRVGLNLIGIAEYGGCVVGEFCSIDRIVALLKLHHIAIGIDEPEEMGRLLGNGIRGTGTEHERIAKNAEICRHAGRVGVEDGVAIYTERHIATLCIDPDALEHSFGFLVFCDILAALTATSRQQHHEQKYDTIPIHLSTIFRCNDIRSRSPRAPLYRRCFGHR